VVQYTLNQTYPLQVPSAHIRRWYSCCYNALPFSTDGTSVFSILPRELGNPSTQFRNPRTIGISTLSNVPVEFQNKVLQSLHPTDKEDTASAVSDSITGDTASILLLVIYFLADRRECRRQRSERGCGFVLRHRCGGKRHAFSTRRSRIYSRIFSKRLSWVC